MFVSLAATGAPIRVPVAVTCRVLKISRQPFHWWIANPITAGEWDQAVGGATNEIHRNVIAAQLVSGGALSL